MTAITNRWRMVGCLIISNVTGAGRDALKRETRSHTTNH